MPRRTDKRNRLIDAADELIHRQGFFRTTLADIAQEADVPLGNVYYYFKTKEAIGVAVNDKRAAEIQELMARWSEQETPEERLLAFLHSGLEDIELIARYGCPIGGLCQELGKEGGGLADLAAKLLHDMLNWVESQFKATGFADVKAKEFAVSLVTSVQGMFLLTHTFKDPSIAKSNVSVLEKWVKATIANVKAAQPEDVVA